jgi:metal-dependent hydrolase (beta-lactamase superfamily II)
MIKTHILAENYSIDDNVKQNNGLSVLIDYHGKKILLDVGHNNYFLSNAKEYNIDLKEVDYLIITHEYYDYKGGIEEFLRINNKAHVYLYDHIFERYVERILFFKYHKGNKIKKQYHGRITLLTDDAVVDSNINLFHFKETKNGVLVIEDNDELLVYNTYSYNNIIDDIAKVKEKMPNKKVRCYLGGLSFFGSDRKYNNIDSYIGYVLKELREMEVTIYALNVNGQYTVNYLRNMVGKKINRINAGMDFIV